MGLYGGLLQRDTQEDAGRLDYISERAFVVHKGSSLGVCD